MKTQSLLAAIVLFGASAASAETLEANVTLAFKVHEQVPPVNKGANSVQALDIYTLKTFDIIQMIAEKENRVFTKKAKLVIQIYYDGGGVDGNSYRIREAGQADLIVTNYFQVNEEFTVEKYKLSIAKNTGTASTMSLAEVEIPVLGDFEGLYLTGPFKSTIRQVQSGEFPDVRLQLTTVSSVLAGQSKIRPLPNTKTGYATGTFKVSGMKILQ